MDQHTTGHDVNLNGSNRRPGLDRTAHPAHGMNSGAQRRIPDFARMRATFAQTTLGQGNRFENPQPGLDRPSHGVDFARMRARYQETKQGRGNRFENPQDVDAPSNRFLELD